MRGRTDLASSEYDDWLARKGKGREVKQRHEERRRANKGYKGWHFGLGDRPVHTKNKEEFKRELERRGLMMRDDVRRELR